MPLERVLQARQQMLGPDAPTTLGSLFVSIPNGSADVKFGTIEVHVRPFQGQSFTDPDSRKIEQDEQRPHVLRRFGHYCFDLVRSQRRLFLPLYLWLGNAANRISVEQFQCDREIQHLLQQHVKIQQRLLLESSSGLLLEKTHNLKSTDFTQSQTAECGQQMIVEVGSV